jgi:hypothetical protein
MFVTVTGQYVFKQKPLFCCDMHVNYICLWHSFLIYGFGVETVIGLQKKKRDGASASDRFEDGCLLACWSVFTSCKGILWLNHHCFPAFIKTTIILSC